MSEPTLHHDPDVLRSLVRRWQRNGARVGLVPTMGNLHAGHVHLVEQARKQADFVVCSVFVNPTQFGPNEDYAAYPRTLDDDIAALRGSGCSAVFAPRVEAMYPGDPAEQITVQLPGPLSNTLCGEFRPGHFDGVVSVLTRLFNAVPADVALFGEKDYQQLLVIRRLVRDLLLPIEIVGVATVRESDGLAMSSRNRYLSAAQRVQAAQIYQTLQTMAEQYRSGADIAGVEGQANVALRAAGFRPDYAVLRRASDLAPIADRSEPVRAVIAARLGQARLIDNLAVDEQ